MSQRCSSVILIFLDRGYDIGVTFATNKALDFRYHCARLMLRPK